MPDPKRDIIRELTEQEQAVLHPLLDMRRNAQARLERAQRELREAQREHHQAEHALTAAVAMANGGFDSTVRFSEQDWTLYRRSEEETAEDELQAARIQKVAEGVKARPGGNGKKKGRGNA